MDDVPRALLVTGRAETVEEVASLASAAGVAVGVVPDAAAAGRAWAAAPLVLVGEDAVARGAPSRRPGVVLLTGEGSGGSGEERWRAAVAVGAEEVLALPRERQAVLQRLALVADLAGSRAGRTVAVLGACGGAGASTLALALALRASGAGPALLVDGDPWGGGLDLLAGLDRSGGFRWPDLAGARGTVRAALLREGLPRTGALGVLAWGRDAPPAGALPAEAVSSVLAAGRRGHDAVVLDLPRRDDPATVAALAASDVLLLVVPGRVRAVAAGAQLLRAVAPHVADVRLVVGTGRAVGGRAAGGREGADPAVPPEAVVDALGAPLAAVVPSDPALARSSGGLAGGPPGGGRRGALARCCEQLDPVWAPEARSPGGGPGVRPEVRAGLGPAEGW